MRIVLLTSAMICLIITLIAFAICSQYDSPGEMLSSKAGTVAAISLGTSFLFVLIYLVAGLLEQKASWRSLIDEIASDHGIQRGERDPEKLVRLIDGTSFATLGHRRVIDCGVMGSGNRMGGGNRGRLAILMLKYGWDGSGDGGGSKILPLIALIGAVPQTSDSSITRGPFLDPDVERKLGEIRQAHPGLDGEIVGGSIYLTFRRNLVDQVLWGFSHPFSTLSGRMRQEYQSMLDALPFIRSVLQANE